MLKSSGTQEQTEDVCEVYDVDCEESTGSLGLIAALDRDDYGDVFRQTELDMTTLSMLTHEDYKLLGDELNRLTHRKTLASKEITRVFEKQ